MLYSVLQILNIFLIFLLSGKQASVYEAKGRLVIPDVNTTNYHPSKLRNLLPENVRVSTSLAAFKIALKTVQLDNE